MDKESERKLLGVSPALASRVHEMADALSRRGIAVRVTSGLRSIEKQRALYADRASNPNPVAKPGTSKHEQGQAIDVGPVGKTSAAIWQAIGEEGKRTGLRWGGDFVKRDPVHFELTVDGVEKIVRDATERASNEAIKRVLQHEVKKINSSDIKPLLIVGTLVVAISLISN